MKLMTGFLMTLDFTPFFSALNFQSPWFLECFNLHTRERNGTKLCTASFEAEFLWMFVYFWFLSSCSFGMDFIKSCLAFPGSILKLREDFQLPNMVKMMWFWLRPHHDWLLAQQGCTLWNIFFTTWKCIGKILESWSSLGIPASLFRSIFGRKYLSLHGQPGPFLVLPPRRWLPPRSSWS